MRSRVTACLVALAAAAGCDGASGGGPADGGNRGDAQVDSTFDGRPDSGAAFPVPRLGNNAGLMDGPVVAPSDGGRHKRIPVQLRTPNPAFEVGAATLVAALGESVFYVVPIRHTGLAPGACGVRSRGIGFELSDRPAGPLFAVRDEVKLTGSVALSGEAWASNCLTGGETGYLLGITIAAADVALYSLAETMVLDVIADAPLDPLDVRVVPTSYTVDEAGLLTVNVVNSGTLPVLVPPGNFSRYVAFGRDGHPVDWGFVGDRVQPSGPVGPGASVLLGRVDPLFLPAPASTLAVFVDVRQPDAATAVSAVRDAEQLLAHQQQAARRNRALSADAEKRSVR